MGHLTEHYNYRGGREGMGWSSTGEYSLKLNCIDIEVEAFHPSFAYERTCFESLTDDLPQGFYGIGPHLTDILLDRVNRFSEIAKPDGIIFDTVSIPDAWIVRAFAEFKSTTLNKLGKKLRRFSSLLHEMREFPEYLPTLLDSLIGDYCAIPSQIFIPHDKQITVFVSSPLPGLRTNPYKTEFSLQYKQVQ